MLVWEACDGEKGIIEIRDYEKSAVYHNVSTQIVLHSVDQLSEAGLNIGHALLAAIGNITIGLEDTEQAEAELMEGLSAAIEGYAERFGAKPDLVEETAPEGARLHYCPEPFPWATP